MRHVHASRAVIFFFTRLVFPGVIWVSQPQALSSWDVYIQTAHCRLVISFSRSDIDMAIVLLLLAGKVGFPILGR